VPTILVIDDDPHTRHLLAHVLQREGHYVVVAEDGIEGVAKHHAELPDLVITDMNMPKQGGVETIIKIRQRNPTAKIVVMSGSGDFDGTYPLIDANRFGAVEVLSKPFKMSELAACVGRVLSNLLGQDNGHALAE